jgi:hypothetical protein
LRGALVLALLFMGLPVSAAPDPPARKEKTPMVGQRPDDPPCKVKLRAALIAQLRLVQERDLPDPPGGWTLDGVVARSARMQQQPRYGVAACVLRLPVPTSGATFLAGLLRDRNPLVALEAAAVLAILGQRTGLEVLRKPEAATNSNIEAVYARAALVLLGEPIPSALRKSRSVFRHLEELIDACPP